VEPALRESESKGIEAMLIDHEAKIITVGREKISYDENTIFHVQTGRYTKGAYSNRYTILGNAVKAFFYYECINIGRGYKKRLILSGRKQPLVRAAS
jgi:hypothetical protein